MGDKETLIEQDDRGFCEEHSYPHNDFDVMVDLVKGRKISLLQAAITVILSTYRCEMLMFRF